MNVGKSVGKKLVVDNLDVILKPLWTVIIGIIGEETYKIYSKRIFNKDASIDSEINELVRDIEENIKE